MKFKDYYFNIEFKDSPKIFTSKTYDTRGFYVKVNNLDRTMVFYMENIEVQGVKVDEGFRIDIPPIETPGLKHCEFALLGNSGERISSKTFKYNVLRSIGGEYGIYRIL